MKSRLAPALLWFLCPIACGEDGVPNANPKGVIQGEVRDGTTGDLLLGVTITVVVEGEARTADTDESGWFVVDGLPAGSTFLVDFALDGYATSRRSIGIDDAAGEHPQSNSITTVLVDLFPNGNEVLVTVVNLDGGQPVEDLTVTARHVPFLCPGGSGGDIIDVAIGETDDAGEVTLGGLATWQEYLIRTAQTDETYSDETCLTIGDTRDAVALQVVPLACDGAPNPICDWTNPMGLDMNGTCDCPGCVWDDADCP